MEREQAVAKAKELFSQGKSHKQIAFALMRDGYSSRKTGKRLTGGGVSYLIRSDRLVRPDQAVRKAPSIRQEGNKIIIEIQVSTK